ncbi:MAG: VOC family protein [Thermomicrobiales bacterium]
MFKDIRAYSGISISDLGAAQHFYGDQLGLDVEAEGPGLVLHLHGGTNVLLYVKDNHEPATFPVLNFTVKNIDEAVDPLVAKGISTIAYPEMGTDGKNIFRGVAQNMGPDVAWFTDPSGNILSVLTN